MDTSPEYVKMCDCPEIQDGWAPSVGDYVWRKYTIFGEVIDNALWPDGKRQEVVILHFKSSVDGYYHAVNAAGDDRTFNSVADMHKATSIWLPRQDQLQEMVTEGFTPCLDLCNLFAWYMHNRPNDIALEWSSLEQLWLAFVMAEKYGKHWNGEAWE
jgi:hypothetical protein